MTRHGFREVKRQVRESGPAGVVAVALVMVASAWGGALWTVRAWARSELLAHDRATAVVAVARGPGEAAAVRDQLHAAFPRAVVAVLRPREVQEELSRWFPELATVLLTLDERSFPSLLQVESEPKKQEEVAAWLQSRAEVTLVESSRAWQARLEAAVSRLLLAGLVLTLAMLAGCCVVLLLVVRLLVLAHADEIAIMRLIGAHEGDIRRPYLISGSLLGALGGVLGGALLMALGLAAHRAVPTLGVAPWTAGALPLTGAVAGAVGAALGLASLPSEP